MAAEKPQAQPVVAAVVEPAHVRGAGQNALDERTQSLSLCARAEAAPREREVKRRHPSERAPHLGRQPIEDAPVRIQLRVLRSGELLDAQVRDGVAARIRQESRSLVMQDAREVITLGMAWNEYIAAMKPAWGALHLHDHVKAMQAGGEKGTRSHKLTAPGALASLATVRLVDLTPELVTEWAKVEGAKRPARARNARTLLSTFLNWCAAHPTYKAIVTGNAAQNKEAKKHLGKPQKKNDALQREQLPAWFDAVKQAQNPVIAAYLQTLLLTGAAFPP